MNSNLYDFPSRPSVKRKDGGGHSGGDGGNGDVLEPRVAKLESHVEHIQRDTTDIKQKLERVADDVSDLKVSMAALAGRQDAFDIKLDTMDKKFEVKLDALDKKFDLRLDALDKKFEVHRGFPGKAALIFRKKYSESLNPYAMRFITLILLFTPSSTLVCIG